MNINLLYFHQDDGALAMQALNDCNVVLATFTSDPANQCPTLIRQGREWAATNGHHVMDVDDTALRGQTPIHKRPPAIHWRPAPKALPTLRELTLA